MVLDAAHDALLARLVEAIRSLHIGQAEDPATVIGPVIDADALEKVHRYIDIGRREGREVLSVDVTEDTMRRGFAPPSE